MKPDPAPTAAAGATPDERKMALAMKLTVIARQLWLDFDQDAEKISL